MGFYYILIFWLKLQFPWLSCSLVQVFRAFPLLAELYSYTEGPEFLLNRKCFEEDFRIHSKSVFLDSSPHREEQGFPLLEKRSLVPELIGMCSCS